MIKPCPFCGGNKITVREGSIFHWWLAQCNECGATGGEVRRQTLGKGTNEEWDHQAIIDAIQRWNERAV